MQTLFRIVLTLLSFTCVSLSQAEGLAAVKDKLAHRYSIYFASAYEGESDLCGKYGSHIYFVQPNEESTPTYEYFISQERVKKGKVLDFKKPEDRVREYTLENFFGGCNAKILIVDLEEDSNLKLAYIFYANEEDDKEGGVMQTYMLIDDESIPLLPQPTTSITPTPSNNP